MGGQLFRFFLRRALLALVTLAAGAGLALTMVHGAGGAGDTYIVNSNGDQPDINLGDCICSANTGFCTLRAAIQEANACPGGQTIRFASDMKITPLTILPPLIDSNTVIDGSDRWLNSPSGEYPGVIVNGDFLTADGLTISVSNCTIKGIGVIHFDGNGVVVSGAAQNVLIGGGGYYQRNLISGNKGNGVRIEAGTKNISVVGNYVGTDPWGKGSATLFLPAPANEKHGVSVLNSEDVNISNNRIANNGWSGVAFDATPSGYVQDNFIGMDTSGGALGNGFYGVHVNDNTTVTINNNAIGFNKRGIHIEGDSIATITFNNIYENNALSLSPSRGGGVLITDMRSEGLLRSNRIYRNLASSGSGVYTRNASAHLDRNWIAANEGSQGAVYIQNTWRVWLINNLITDNKDLGVNIINSAANIRVEHNTIAGNQGSGTRIYDTTVTYRNTIAASNGGYGLEVSGESILVHGRNVAFGNTLGSSNGGILFYMTRDPKFMNPTAGDYALKPDSPCLDATLTSTELKTMQAYNDVPRILGAAGDIGAYEMGRAWLPVMWK